MFRPNLNCVIKKQGSYDQYGMPIVGQRVKERCAVVRLRNFNEKSSVRADSSASRGNAREMQASVLILLQANTQAEHDCVIELNKDQYRIMSMHARFNIAGKVDHYEVECTYWSETP